MEDAAAWELAKENMQPLRAGRNARALEKAAVSAGGDADAGKTREAEARRSELLAAIENDGSDDPLAAHLRLIKWTQETFPSGNAALLPVLERCTRELLSCAARDYRDDVRFLRVWVLYANCVDDARDIFKFCEVNNIGQGHALFYEAAAVFHEYRREHRRADECYAKGVANGAKPLDRLKAKYEAFKGRMVRRIQKQVASGEPVENDGDDDGHEGGERQFGNGLFGAAGAADAAPSQQQQRPRQQDGGGLAVFVDGEFGGAEGSTDAAAPSWANLPSRRDMRKENDAVPGKWNDAPLRGSVAANRAARGGAQAAEKGPALELFVDDEFQQPDHAALGNASGHGAGKLTLRERLDGKLERTVEDIQSNPLRNHLVKAPSAAAAAAPKRAAKPAAGEEVRGYDASLIQGADGEEQCFEEVRGALWLAELAASADAPEPPGGDLEVFDDMQMDAGEAEEEDPPLDEPIAMRESPPQQLQEEGAGAADDDGTTNVLPPRALFQDCDDTVSLPRRNPRAGAEEDATLCTREAFASVLSVFSEDLPSERKAGGPAPRSAAHGAAAAPPPASDFAVFAEEDAGDGAPRAPVDATPAAPVFAVFDENGENDENAAATVPLRRARAPLSVVREAAQPDGGDGGGDAPMAEADENAAPQAAALAPRAFAPRALTEPGVEASVLQPLSPSRRAALNVPAEDGCTGDGRLGLPGDENLAVPSAEQLMADAAAAGAAALDDSFEVYEDGGAEDGGMKAGTAMAVGGFVQANLEGGSAGASASASEAAPSVLASLCPSMTPPSARARRRSVDARTPGPSSAPVAGSAEFDHCDQSYRESLLMALDPPLAQRGDVYVHVREDDGTGGEPAGLSLALRRARQSPGTSAPGEVAGRGGSVGGGVVDLEGSPWLVGGMLGTGAFASVYSARLLPADGSADAGDDTWIDSGDGGPDSDVRRALKVQNGADAALGAWEFYVLREVQGRLKLERDSIATRGAAVHLSGAFPKARALHVSDDGLLSVVCLSRHTGGTIQDLVNVHLASGRRLEETLVLFYAVELFSAVGTLHSLGLAHGDVKADNILLRGAGSKEGGELEGDWAKVRTERWLGTGIVLCDFGRSADLLEVPPDAAGRLMADDGLGCADVLHVLLHGSYLEVEKDAQSGAYRPKQAFRRYQRSWLWEEVFGALLNPPDGDGPDFDALRARVEAALASEVGEAKKVRLALMKASLALQGA